MPHADITGGPAACDTGVPSTPFAFGLMRLVSAGGLRWPSDELDPTRDEGKRTHDDYIPPLAAGGWVGLPHVPRKHEDGCRAPGEAMIGEAVAGKLDFCNRL